MQLVAEMSVQEIFTSHHGIIQNILLLYFQYSMYGINGINWSFVLFFLIYAWDDMG
jgi:hypothetical protein